MADVGASATRQTCETKVLGWFIMLVWRSVDILTASMYSITDPAMKLIDLLNVLQLFAAER